MNEYKDIEITVKIRNNLIKERRLKLGLTQGQLAEECNVSISIIQSIECFKYKSTSINGLIKVCEYFKCNPEDIYPAFFKNIRKTKFTKCLDNIEFINLTDKKELLQIEECHKNPEDTLIENDLKDIILKVVDTLRKNEAEVIKYRYGLNGNDLTLEQIGNKMKLSRERVRQLELRALRKLRTPKSQMILESYGQKNLQKKIITNIQKEISYK